MLEFAIDPVTIVVGIGSLVMLVIGPSYFVMLRKVLSLAKEIDPAAWTRWGQPEHLTDLSFKQNRDLIRAIGKQADVNGELKAHPTFKMARRLYRASTAVLFVMFATIVGSGLIARFSEVT